MTKEAAVAKKEKVEIIQCLHCKFYHPIGNTVDGICTVSAYRAYRKWNHNCEKAVRKHRKLWE